MKFTTSILKVFSLDHSATKRSVAGFLLLGTVVGASIISCRTRSGNTRLTADAGTAQAIEVLNILGAQSPHLPAGSTH